MKALRDTQPHHWATVLKSVFIVWAVAGIIVTPSRKKSHERDLRSLKPLAKVFMGRELATINGAEVRQYIAERKQAGIAPTTINREIGLASAAINWARCELEWALVNPFQGGRQAVPPGRERWLSREEADLLITDVTHRAVESLCCSPDGAACGAIRENLIANPDYAASGFIRATAYTSA